MGACANVECPKCHKEFIVTPSLLGMGVKLHCPFCDLYFLDSESPNIWRPGGSWGSGLAASPKKKVAAKAAAED
jgi:hypothetical protein